MIKRPAPTGPERRDVPVTILFTPYTPERRFNMEGWFMEQACGGVKGCPHRPLFILESNVSMYGACEEHLSIMVARGIEEAQRYGGDLDDAPGFLHRLAPQRRSTAVPMPVPAYDPAQAVWESVLDGRFNVAVYRTPKSPRFGVLVVREAAQEPIFEGVVGLSYGAAFGPDASDAEEWRHLAAAAIDGAKPLRQRLDEALARRDAEMTALSATLRTSAALALFEKALEAYEDADQALMWMVQPNAALDGKTPVAGADDERRRAATLDLVDQIRNWDLRMAARASQLEAGSGEPTPDE